MLAGGFVIQWPYSSATYVKQQYIGGCKLSLLQRSKFWGGLLLNRQLEFISLMRHLLLLKRKVIRTGLLIQTDQHGCQHVRWDSGDCDAECLLYEMYHYTPGTFFV